MCVVAGVRKLKLPAILGYLTVGMLLGPHALALAHDNDTTRLLADFGVVFLVFTLGLEFSLPRLIAMRWEVLGVGGAQVLATTGIVAAAAVLVLGIAPAVAIVVGGAVAMSSTAIIISQLTEQSENNRSHGRVRNACPARSRRSVNRPTTRECRIGLATAITSAVAVRSFLQRRRAT